jgi:hypothetical protein
LAFFTGDFRKAEVRRRRRRILFCVFFALPVNTRDELQILLDAQIRRNGRFLRRDVCLLLNGLRVFQDAVAEQDGVAGSRLNQAGQHFYRRRFARAVYAKQSEQLALLYREVQIVHGGKRAVFFLSGRSSLWRSFFILLIRQNAAEGFHQFHQHALWRNGNTAFDVAKHDQRVSRLDAEQVAGLLRNDDLSLFADPDRPGVFPFGCGHYSLLCCND